MNDRSLGGQRPFGPEGPPQDARPRQQGRTGPAETPLEQTPANVKKIRQLQKALAEILAKALQRGFFGIAGLEFNVQDGTIQQIRQRLERIDK